MVGNRQMIRRSLRVPLIVSLVPALLSLALLPSGKTSAAGFEWKTTEVAWQQVAPKKSFRVFVEREELSNLDRVSRMIFAVQVGPKGPKLSALSARWQIKRGDTLIAENIASMRKGLADVRFSLAGLQPGRYDVSAQLMEGDKILDEGNTFFRYTVAALPPQQGRVALVLPRGAPIREGGYPVTCGVPFPKGALWNANHVRLVRSDGKPVPVQTTVRSPWGHTPETSIRWLGVDFQAANAPAWWPERKDRPYFLEFGPEVRGPTPPVKVNVAEADDGVRVDTGPLNFLVRRSGFNLIDEVRLNGAAVMRSTPKGGLYLVDHEGGIYRAANDPGTRLTVEEQGDLRVVIRAEGWYVKDGTTGEGLSYTLPTDKLCKFITRIEAYAGKPYIRILHTWVLTFASHTVRLRDVGLDLPVEACTRAEFGVEQSQPIVRRVGAKGVYLIQHMPHEFAVEDGAGKPLEKGKHSAGWVMATTRNGLIGVGLRDTWQRFPKEFEVLPDAIRLHIWPAHGRGHPAIKETEHSEIHKLWFAHQGKELNMAQPWPYVFAVAQISGTPATGIYSATGQALAGVHASALGAARTSDLTIHFAAGERTDEVRDVSACFQAAPHAMADPEWICDSRAVGYMHPYDPVNMKTAEQVIEDLMRGYWEIQDTCGDYGMWIYRGWRDQRLVARGKYLLYRLYNTTHHYDAFMPWMLYARSGDPFYLRQGSANIRLLTDAQMIHYDDPAYPHRELWGQGRLVGSTRHTNGFNTWGGDHGVFGHLTCYNAIILAYYLTGDLRLREVVVDEWQKTILTDRANPQYHHVPDRTGSAARYAFWGGRNANCALSELIDLYQMTYEPAILAHVAPLMDYYLSTSMYHWGQPLHNVLLFYGSAQAKRQLLEGIDVYRKANGHVDWKVAKSLWFTHSPHENFALASIVDPPSKAHVEAWLTANIPKWRVMAGDFRKQVPHDASRFPVVKFCKVPDYVNHLPRTMYAVMSAGGDVSLSQLPERQPMPIGDMKLRGWMRAIVKEEEDRPFDVAIRGSVQADGVPVKVYGPDNQLVLETKVPGGEQDPFAINVPKDGKIGEYVVFVKARDPGLKGSKLYVPMTELPEVYHLGYWQQHAKTHFFTRSRGDEPETIGIHQHGGGGLILKDGPAPDDWKLLAGSRPNMKPFSETPMTCEIDPQGAWVLTGGYVNVTGPKVTLSCSPDRWFAPSEEKTRLKP